MIRLLKKISTVLKTDVCCRFPKVSGREYDLYTLDKMNRTVTLDRADLIRVYSIFLFDLINYRWTQKLEEFNNLFFLVGRSSHHPI